MAGHTISRVTPSTCRTVGRFDLVVVVLLGVELGERLGVPGQLEVLDGSARGIAGVVPALEGGDEDRVTKYGHALSVAPASSVSGVSSSRPAGVTGNYPGLTHPAYGQHWFARPLVWTACLRHFTLPCSMR